MLTEKNVRIVSSDGSACFVCDERMRVGEKAIEVSFKIVVTVTKHMHPVACAKKLRDILDLRIREVE